MSKLLVAAIDFGTTFSGYAFSFMSDYKTDPLKISANNAWNAGGQCLLSLKTPTVLYYDPKAIKDKQILFGYEAQNAYLALTQNDDKTLHKKVFYFSLFKMQLYGDKTLTSDIEIKDETGKSMKALEVFQMSIMWLKEHLISTLTTQGTGVVANEIKWVLTVPAIWNDSAKQFMRQAAEKAGLIGDDLVIALEPEAASVYCQHLPVDKLKTTGGTTFSVSKAGTKYMVVDLGGGTADITVHEKLENNKLKELWKASGGAWGGSAVNEQFYKLWSSIVSEKAMTRFKQNCTEDYLEMGREFEVTKRTIDSKKTTKTTLKIPASLNETCMETTGKTIKETIAAPNHQMKGDLEVVSDKMRVSPARIHALFEVVIAGIVSHIEDILNKPAVKGVKLMLMVGGFSESTIVQERIRDAVKRYDIKIIIPPEAGLAVLKGAVIYGHDTGAVKSRITRYTYGVDITPDFDSTKHPLSKKLSISGKDRCLDVFSTFMRPGQSVESGQKVIQVYTTGFPNQESVRFRVFTTLKEDPKFVDEPGSQGIGELTLTVPKPTEADQALVVAYVFGDTELKMIGMAAEEGTPCMAAFKLPKDSNN